MNRIKRNEVDRAFVWGFRFTWLGIRLCVLFAAALVSVAKISSSVFDFFLEIPF